MPTYNYECIKKYEGCGHTMEIVQKMSDDKLTNCPKCNATNPKFQRVIRGSQKPVFVGQNWNKRGGIGI